MQKQENNTVSTNSIPKKQSTWFSFKRFFCPCLLPSPKKDRFSNPNDAYDPMEPENSLRSSQQSKNSKKKRVSSNKQTQNKGIQKLVLPTLEMQLKKQTLLDKLPGPNEQYSQIVDTPAKPHKRRSVGILRNDYPVCGLCDKELISVGINDRHLLVRIANIHLSPNASALKRQLAQGKPHRIKQSQAVSNIDRFWHQRYALFQRFDQGIRLDDPSWAKTPPGPVCQWIAGKCCQASLILDAFAGVGGTSIRMANSPQCMKIIANDWNGKRLQCLLNNAKVYDVDRCVELSQNNFLDFSHKGIQVVFAQPPIDEEMRTTSTGCLSIVDFEPTLDKIISKAMSLAPNFILLLPPAISIDVLCSCINKCASEHGKMKNSCSAKIEKIYYQGQLKYVLISVGRMVQDQVKLSHQLNFIYAKLLENQNTSFHYKKLVKAIRQEFGMIFLLNLIKQCEKKKKQLKNKGIQKAVFDIFVESIRDKSLLPSRKLDKLLTEHQTSMEKKRSQLNISNDKSEQSSRWKDTRDNIPFEAIMQQQKTDDQVPYLRMSEQTQSQSSHYSYLEGLGNQGGSNRPPRVFAQSFGSIQIKRTLNESKQKRTISPNSPGRNVCPNQKIKVAVSPRRQSHITIKKEKPISRNMTRNTQLISKKSK